MPTCNLLLALESDIYAEIPDESSRPRSGGRCHPPVVPSQPVSQHPNQALPPPPAHPIPPKTRKEVLPALPTLHIPPRGAEGAGMTPYTMGRDLWVLAEGVMGRVGTQGWPTSPAQSGGSAQERAGVQAASRPLALPPLPLFPCPSSPALRDLPGGRHLGEDPGRRLLRRGLRGDLHHAGERPALPLPCLPPPRFWGGGEWGQAAPSSPSPCRKGSGSTWP